MDIKLRARLTAYSKIETFDRPTDDTPNHTCNMAPISKEAIDELFRTVTSEVEQQEQPITGKSFIDSLF